MAESGNVSPRELQKLRKDLGLDRPYHEQYLIWIWQMVTLNPGYSIFTGDAISVSLKKSIPVTIELAALAMVFGLLIAIPVGVLSATRQDKPADYIGRLVAVSGLSFPDFWLGTLVITFAAIWFGWIPPLGYTSVWESPWRNIQQFLLPAAILGFRLSAATMRMTRSTLLEVLREDYVRTAWAKGLPSRMVIVKHALRNSLIATVTVVGLQTARLLGGSTIVETVFSWPGVGRLLIEGIYSRDYPIVQGSVLIIAVTYVFINLFVDIAYKWVDPRIKLE
jgi:peptide/nickel transport system permease protein